MHVFLVTLQAVGALLGIGVLGFWIIGRRQIPATALALLTAIAIDISIPCLVLKNLLTEFSPQKYPGWWHLPLEWLALSLILLAFSIAASFLAQKRFRGEFAMGLFFQNAIFFPLIIISGLFADPGPYLVSLFLFVAFQPTVVFSAYPLFFRHQTRESVINWRRIVNPVLILTLVGLIIGLTGVQSDVPDFVITILTLVGGMSVPLFMLILGGNIYNDFVSTAVEGRKFYPAEIVKFTLVKNFAFPLAILGLLVWLRPDYNLAFLAILQAAVPPITAIPLLAERSGGNRSIGNQFVLFSFVVSIISIPLILYLFSLFFAVPAG
jgi:malate permease and related proteins